tara:strand:+ start:262 stop:522 length:261 start_codon:yes stop_codon:yes gene_type:complete
VLESYSQQKNFFKGLGEVDGSKALHRAQQSALIPAEVDKVSEYEFVNVEHLLLANQVLAFTCNCRLWGSKRISSPKSTIMIDIMSI